MDSVIIRHGAPTKMDHAPFGTSCKVIHETSESFDLWKQFSTKEDEPQWQFMGTFQGDAESHICDQLNK